ncbi:nitroreductase family deazaflavin-dependent oxidoreductase [Nonomuraea sp. K274]|uniref:Nitroreductase family deazaflavin-dependent oxidoreductase n=1 Tax=Nonomuraea cypriaca TaxID=1187855 RepID=A0A931ACC3_9ACTN|nr:nitroreductase family deazaflavin-dependent oxidoreductase [Nonomuraea cypriaca]MBF8187544.1 nitroreductase family deazaflavin-dependent oxidoreductase [Nonomuraea cypriaca]
MEIVKTVTPPAGVGRFLFRLPLGLYRMGLGWVFGHRIMVVNHVGRVTGKRRQVVLEVVEAGRSGFVAASGWGPSAAWYRNVLHTPDVTLQIGTRTIPVKALPLSQEEGAEVFTRYASRHRRTAMALLRLMGFSVDGSEADFLAAGQRIPFIRFVPRPV